MTPSGILSQRYLRWAMEVIGAERIMFAADYPFVPLPEEGAATRFLREADISESERNMISSDNWDRLRGQIRR